MCVHIVRVRSDISTLLLLRSYSDVSCVCSYSESTKRHIHTLTVKKLFRFQAVDQVAGVQVVVDQVAGAQMVARVANSGGGSRGGSSGSGSSCGSSGGGSSGGSSGSGE